MNNEHRKFSIKCIIYNLSRNSKLKPSYTVVQISQKGQTVNCKNETQKIIYLKSNQFTVCRYNTYAAAMQWVKLLTKNTHTTQNHNNIITSKYPPHSGA